MVQEERKVKGGSHSGQASSTSPVSPHSAQPGLHSALTGMNSTSCGAAREAGSIHWARLHARQYSSINLVGVPSKTLSPKQHGSPHLAQKKVLIWSEQELC